MQLAGTDPDRCARIGAIAFIHRFGSALNTHLHFHCVVIDACSRPRPPEAPSSIPASRSTGSPLAPEWLHEIGLERLVYDHPQSSPGSGGTLITPLELLDRRAALVPPPRVHRHRCYGVLAPNAPLRRAVTAMAIAPPPPAAHHRGTCRSSDHADRSEAGLRTSPGTAIPMRGLRCHLLRIGA